MHAHNCTTHLPALSQRSTGVSLRFTRLYINQRKEEPHRNPMLSSERTLSWFSPKKTESLLLSFSLSLLRYWSPQATEVTTTDLLIYFLNSTGSMYPFHTSRGNSSAQNSIHSFTRFIESSASQRNCNPSIALIARDHSS